MSERRLKAGGGQNCPPHNLPIATLERGALIGIGLRLGAIVVRIHGASAGAGTGAGGPRTVGLDAPLERIPVLARAGSVIPLGPGKMPATSSLAGGLG